jgi:hypothetical protein
MYDNLIRCNDFNGQLQLIQNLGFNFNDFSM